MPSFEQHSSDSRWGELIVRTWFDPSLKRRLLDDPLTVLREAGIEVPPDVEVIVMEETPGQRIFVLPCPPEKISHADVQDAQANLAQPVSRFGTGGAGTAHVLDLHDDND